MVRPERVQRWRREGGGNRFRAAVESVRLLGSTVGVALKAGDASLKATLLNEYPLDVTPGVDAEWRVAVADTIVLPSR
jgi:hypothetical protein